MQKTAISQRQFALLTISLLVTASLLNLPHFLIELSGADAPFTVAIMAVYGLAITAYLVMLSKRFPQKNLFEIHEIIFGRIGGTAINLVLLVHIWFIFMRNIRLFNFFVKITLLPRTPTEILLILFFFVLIYYGSTSLEVSARVNELLFPFLLAMELLLPFLLLGQFSFNSIEPYFVQPISHVGLAGAAGCTWFGDVVVMGAFLQMLAAKPQMKAAFRLAVVTASFLIGLFLTLSVLVFGSNMTSRQVYPAYSLKMQILLTDFLDRLELPFLMIYFPIFFVTTAVVFIAMMIGIGTITKSRDHTRFSRSLGLLLLLTCLFGFRGTADVNLFSNYGLPVYVMIIEPLTISIVLLGLWIKDSREKTRVSGREVPSSPDGPATANGAGKDAKPGWAQTKWAFLTNLAVGLAVGFILIGFTVGLDRQAIAIGCAIGYHVCLVISIFTALRESRRARIETANT